MLNMYILKKTLKLVILGDNDIFSIIIQSRDIRSRLKLNFSMGIELKKAVNRTVIFQML